MPALGEVQIRKLALKLFSFLVVGACRFFFGHEAPDMQIFSLKYHPDSPYLILGVPRYALVFSASRSALAEVPMILCSSSKAQVFIRIVERIAVYVVSTVTVAMDQTKNLAVHVYDVFAFSAASVIRMIVPAVSSAPVIAGEMFETVSANLGYLTHSQRNKAIRTSRLDEFSAFFYWACHNRNNNTFKEAQLA